MVLAVVAWRGDLLGARLSNWLNAWRFATKLGCQALIVWRNSDENRIYPYNLYTLFDRSGLDSFHSMRVQLLDPPADIRPYHWQPPLEWANTQWISIEDVHPDSCTSLPKNALIDYFTTSPKYFPNEDKKADQIEVANLFRSLPLHADIKVALDSISEITALPFAALHLRRGNLVEYLFKRSASTRQDQLFIDINNFIPRYAHLNNYARALLNETPNNLPVIIFSDDLSLRTEASMKINRHVLDIHTVLDGFQLSDLQRAFVEFIVISRADYVIGAKSQFSVLPARINNAKYIDARKYANAAEVADDLRPLILGSNRLDASNGELGRSIFSEFAKMYERIDPELGSSFKRIADKPL